MDIAIPLHSPRPASSICSQVDRTLAKIADEFTTGQMEEIVFVLFFRSIVDFLTIIDPTAILILAVMFGALGLI